MCQAARVICITIRARRAPRTAKTSPRPEENDILLPMPDEAPKRLIVVGDRVLIAPEEGEERTNVGLYLPPTAVETRQVQGGRIVATGPGTPMTEPASMHDHPLNIRRPALTFHPLHP